MLQPEIGLRDCVLTVLGCRKRPELPNKAVHPV